MSNRVPMYVRLPRDLHQRLTDLARRERRSLNEQVVRLLETHPDVEAMTMVATAHVESEIRRMANERLLDRRDAIERGEEADFSLSDADLDGYFEFEPDLDSPVARTLFREEWERGAREMGAQATED